MQTHHPFQIRAILKISFLFQSALAGLQGRIYTLSSNGYNSSIVFEDLREPIYILSYAVDSDLSPVSSIDPDSLVIFTTCYRSSMIP